MMSVTTYVVLVIVMIFGFFMGFGYWFSCAVDRCWHDQILGNVQSELPNVTMLLSNVIQP